MAWPQPKPQVIDETFKGANQPLLTPYTMGPFELADRMVYAPLTRCRALGTIPQPNAALYYSQRARKGGLMLSEGASPSPTGYGYPHTPGIFSPEHIAAWKPITQAVKDAGAIFFCQLWHVGRVSHTDFQPDGTAPMAPSAIAVKGQTYTYEGPKDFSVPREMTKEDMETVKAEIVQATKNALEAGFAGVEMHGAHGYLLETFLKDTTNTRTDEYGGSVENRARFPLEVVAAVVAAVGADKVGIRLSPFTHFMDAVSTYPYGQYCYVLEKLAEMNLLYVHMVEPRVNESMGGATARDAKDSLAPFRAIWPNTFISAGGHDQVSGNSAIDGKKADLICYGRTFIANPDMPLRFRLGAPLTPYDRDTFYSQGEAGYTDYPFLDEALAKELEAKLN